MLQSSSLTERPARVPRIASPVSVLEMSFPRLLVWSAAQMEKVIYLTLDGRTKISIFVEISQMERLVATIVCVKDSVFQENAPANVLRMVRHVPRIPIVNPRAALAVSMKNLPQVFAALKENRMYWMSLGPTETYPFVATLPVALPVVRI